MSDRSRVSSDRQIVEGARYAEKKGRLGPARIFAGLATAVFSLLLEHHDAHSARYNTVVPHYAPAFPTWVYEVRESFLLRRSRHLARQQQGRPVLVPVDLPQAANGRARLCNISDSRWFHQRNSREGERAIYG